jgi:hypothetical protein
VPSIKAMLEPRIVAASTQARDCVPRGALALPDWTTASSQGCFTQNLDSLWIAL